MWLDRVGRVAALLMLPVLVVAIALVSVLLGGAINRC